VAWPSNTAVANLSGSRDTVANLSSSRYLKHDIEYRKKQKSYPNITYFCWNEPQLKMPTVIRPVISIEVVYGLMIRNAAPPAPVSTDAAYPL